MMCGSRQWKRIHQEQKKQKQNNNNNKMTPVSRKRTSMEHYLGSW
jgi:hypothetical protein